MTSSRPYMLRAIYQWILDNQCTPYLLVNADSEGVVVPQDFVQDGQIVLNISEVAVAGLNIDNNFVSFSGRFGGVSQDIWVPVGAVLAIYAKENGQGMLFDPDDDGPDSGDAPKRPSLKVVK